MLKSCSSAGMKEIKLSTKTLKRNRKASKSNSLVLSLERLLEGSSRVAAGMFDWKSLSLLCTMPE